MNPGKNRDFFLSKFFKENLSTKKVRTVVLPQNHKGTKPACQCVSLATAAGSTKRFSGIFVFWSFFGLKNKI